MSDATNTTDHVAAIRQALERHDNYDADFSDTMNIVEKHLDALAAERDALRAYARHLEPYAARHSVLPGDDEDTAVTRARARYGVTDLMDPDEPHTPPTRPTSAP